MLFAALAAASLSGTSCSSPKALDDREVAEVVARSLAGRNFKRLVELAIVAPPAGPAERFRWCKSSRTDDVSATAAPPEPTDRLQDQQVRSRFVMTPDGVVSPGRFESGRRILISVVRVDGERVLIAVEESDRTGFTLEGFQRRGLVEQVAVCDQWKR